MNSWKTIGFIATVIIVLSIPIKLIQNKNNSLSNVYSNKAVFVGSETCIECHRIEYESWLKSHHAKSMAVATEKTVLGNFDTVLTDGDNTHKFYKKDGKFYVYTEGKDGQWNEYEVTHTFGYAPLQQYLVPFEKGKYQTLSLTWDTIKKEWYNMSRALYGHQVTSNDWLHWTNQAQNWNGMCSECHSTNLKKNYFYRKDSFNTTYSEINVSCEACHGPGSEHLEWARLPRSSRPDGINTGLVAKTSGINNVEYVELCARCHSRRAQFDNFNHYDNDLFDYMHPNLIGPEYFADGQILDEDYVYGSFLQSKMYDNDIKCNDCHDVHSGERYFEDNQLCFQCHENEYYGTSKHTFHKNYGEPGEPYYISGKKVEIGEGAQCVNCHMPGRYYMGIDFRNDHSIRNPRPDLTIEIGVPNACNQCHTDKSAQWALNYVEKWYGEKKRPHYGTAIAAGREGHPEAESQLVEIIKDTLKPLIIRATAIELLRNYNSPKKHQLIQKYLDELDPMLRLAAINTYSNQNTNTFTNDIGPMLSDPVKAVRTRAALLFSQLPEENIPEQYREPFTNALEELKEANEYMADFPGGRLNMGIMYTNMGKPREAIKHYEKAIETDTAFVPAMLNLAMSYNSVKRNAEAIKIYQYLLDYHPDIEGMNYSMGLLLAEEKRFEEATHYLEKAAQNNPQNTRIKYNLALLYQKLNRFNDAERTFRKIIRSQEDNFDYWYALAYMYISQNQKEKAGNVANELHAKFPDSPDAKKVVDYIRGLLKR